MYASSWYYSLTKPFLAPPNWIFAPVWTFLYASMFISVLIFILGGRCGKWDKHKNYGIMCFLIQLVLNLLWSPAFFVMRNIGLALIVVILLDIFLYLTIKEFYKISKPSGLLLVPYLIWTLFATYLNAGYLLLNN